MSDSKLSAYPGLGLPLRHDPQSNGNYGHYPIGAHGSCWGAESDMIMIRELAMMTIMDKLTDKVDWHKKILDDDIVAKWRKEAQAIPDQDFSKIAYSGKRQYWDNEGRLTLHNANKKKDLDLLKGIITDNTFDCCIQELRSKGKYYKESKIVPTLDACASVAKSDELVSADLHQALLTAFDKLKAHQSSAPDWHPNSNKQVQDLVHPSMYPLVYGRSRVLKEEVVGVAEAIKKWAGKGDVIPKDKGNLEAERGRRYNVGSEYVPPEYWSDTFQWLPANVEFQDDGSIRLTSYINGLHPTKFPDIYRTIEKLIETALPAWDQCLSVASDYQQKTGAGRLEPRIGYPADPDDENVLNWDPPGPEAMGDAKGDSSKMDLGNDTDTQSDDDTESDSDSFDDNDVTRWESLRKPVIPEPTFEDVDYVPAAENRLAKKFRETGLQIIVKIASIELTPEKPDFPQGGWHIEGQMNEHICGTALYYLDSENITSSNLSFRMQTSAYLSDEIHVGQDCFHYLEQIYGTGLGGRSDPCLQNYGSVETRAGRLLAFPNVFQHRVSPFRLEDPTKPGYRRFIALWLVDPTQRIISTANVPPQQMSWWLDSILGQSPESRETALSKLPIEIIALMNDKGLDADADATGEAKLPVELMELVRQHFNSDKDSLLMSLEEAHEHRLKLMQERSAHVQTSERWWQQHSYGFCEH
ncbi:hypothetical protein EJ04DRAFT_466559 [Polyplosphaeria fusca]|uniref:Uncharacterized protein n=1 Tax=Polyplosphaeria fusca TaxID=682080 RepID=A0A9P4QVJ1_9PLEO|nr:hypothetical protein EJ04DRAFT_466559 [Polyplosphaeria fusca]